MEEESSGIGEVEEDPAHKTKEDVATREKPGTPGGERNGDHSRHERSASIITTGTYIGPILKGMLRDCGRVV